MTKITDVRTKDGLIELLSYGIPAQYLFFWGHQAARNGNITKSCFSQWYPSPFNFNGVIYKTAEHFMMAKKAELFEDMDIVDKVLCVEDPAEAKKLGRKVKGFDDTVWKKHRFNLVIEGNFEKFLQHEDLKRYLISTEDKVLVEASPVDKIWGVGLAESDKEINIPYKWKGLNLLGFALMEVRSRLSC